MGKIYRSMRGEVVDIDLLKIKNQILNSERTDAVVKREDFVKNKRRRNVKRRLDEIMANQRSVSRRLDYQKRQENASDSIDEDTMAKSPKDDSSVKLQKPTTTNIETEDKPAVTRKSVVKKK